MSYVEHSQSLAVRLLQAMGWITLVLMLAFCGLTAPLWFRSSTVQYYVYPRPGESAADRLGMQNPGCELYGKVVERDGRTAIRFRFPNDRELEDCFKASVPDSSRIEKASWLETQLNRPRPVWL